MQSSPKLTCNQPPNSVGSLTRCSMLTVWWLALIVVLTALNAPHAHSKETIEPLSSGDWKEAVVSVTDLERSAQFFIELGGYDIRWRGKVSSGELASFGLDPQASGEALLLGHADHTSGLVRLIRFDDAGRKEPMRPGSRAWDTGCYFSLMVRVKNVQQLYDDAIAMGWWTETPITPLEFGESKLRIVIFKGPDGLQIQAYERLTPPLPDAVGDFESMTRPFSIMQMVDGRDRALSFLTNILGFDTWFAGPPHIAKKPEHSPIGIPYSLTNKVRYHAAIVYPRPSEFGRMEVIDLPDIKGRDHSSRCDAPNLGILALRFPVVDLRKTAARIVKRSWPIEQEILDAVVEPYGAIKLLSIKSPDGAIVTFFERK